MRHDLFQLAEHLAASMEHCDRLIDEIRNLSEYGSLNDVEEFTKVIKRWAK
jgi:hypothetical protein